MSVYLYRLWTIPTYFSRTGRSLREKKERKKVWITTMRLELECNKAIIPSSTRDNGFLFLLRKLDPKRLRVARFFLLCWLY